MLLNQGWEALAACLSWAETKKVVGVGRAERSRYAGGNGRGRAEGREGGMWYV